MFGNVRHSVGEARVAQLASIVSLQPDHIRAARLVASGVRVLQLVCRVPRKHPHAIASDLPAHTVTQRASARHPTARRVDGQRIFVRRAGR